LHWERAKIEQQWKRYTQAIEQAEEAYRAYKSYEPSVNELTKAATVALEVAGWLISLKEFDQARDWLNRVNSLKCRELYYMAREAEEARLMHFVIQANVMFARLHIERMGQTEDSLAISLEYLEQALEHARNYAPDLETTLRRFIAVAEQERERLNQPNSPVRISDHGLKNPAYCACGEYLLLLDYLRGNVEVCFQCNNAYHKHHKQCPYCGVSKHKCPYCHMLYSEEATP
jgi:tetratricopeptide (TPR) repeat protein